MSDNKSNLNKKIAAGAILVALSGFVPNVTKPAHAATASIGVTGSFTSGIKMTAGTDVQFGKLVGTDKSGALTIKTGGGTIVSKGFFVGTPKAGTIAFSAGALKNVDITVAGLKAALTLAATANGGKTGVVNLAEAQIGGPFALQTFVIATPAITGVALTSTTADLAIGATVTWGDPAPIGTFSETLAVTISF